MFNVKTGPHWQLRRNSFKHAFSITSLRSFQDAIKALTDQLVDILAKKAPSVVKMDVLFGQLTIDVICKVGFGLDIHALQDSPLFQVILFFITALDLLVSYESTRAFDRNCMTAWFPISRFPTTKFHLLKY